MSNHAEIRVLHARERNYSGPRIVAERSHAAGPGSLCGIPFLELPEGHWVTSDDCANCPDCLSALERTQ